VADGVQQPAGAPGWQAVVAELYRRRAEAFRTGSVAPLDAVYAPGSPLLVADRAAVTELAARGQVLRGFAPAVTAVTGVEATPGRAELRLVDHRPAAAVVTAGGALVAGTPARPDAPVRMVLAATPAGWRIESAELLAEPAGQPRPSAAASAGPSSGWANE
jgi:hypothetical protein